jgi:hypothetical protein
VRLNTENAGYTDHDRYCIAENLDTTAPMTAADTVGLVSRFSAKQYPWYSV